jgi:hypothetical protein
MVISPSSSHAFRLLVVQDDLAEIWKRLVAYWTLGALLGDFSIQQLPISAGERSSRYTRAPIF